MFFETRQCALPVSPHLQTVCDQFMAGDTSEAAKNISQAAVDYSPKTANDWLLLIEILRASARHRRAVAAARLAYRRFPESFALRIYRIRAFLYQHRFQLAIDFMESLMPQMSIEQLEGQIWLLECADTYAAAGFTTTSRALAERHQAIQAVAEPVSLYLQAFGASNRREWLPAIEYAERCVALAPRFMRGHAVLINALLSVGRVADAQHAFEQAEGTGIRDATLEGTAAVFAFSMGNFAEAEQRFRRVLTDWPQADYRHWVRRTLIILLADLGRADDARAVLAAATADLGLPPLPSSLSGRHSFLSLPLITQNHNECVPTCVAMVMHAQGKKLSPAQAFQEMLGREGVALWRARQWVQAQGYEFVCIKPQSDAVMALLDAGIALIGSTEGAFSAHVEVICGYQHDLAVFYLRDPMDWAPSTLGFSDLIERYGISGALFAIIDPANSSALALARSNHAPVGTALLDLAQACANADRIGAEQAFAQLPDDPRTASRALNPARGVVISPDEYQRRIEALADDPNAPLVTRLRALMNMGAERLEHFMQEAQAREELDIGSYLRRYFTLRLAFDRGDWQQAEHYAELLTKLGPANPDIWEYRADIAAELGDREQSNACLARAIELEPMRASLRQKQLRRREHQLTYTEYRDEITALMREHPDETPLLWTFAGIAQDGPDGLEYEQALRNYLKWYPRQPAAYERLLDWYRDQEREDLAQDLLAEAQRLLPEAFPPTSTQSEGSAQPAASPAPEPLPSRHEHEALVDLAWDTTDPRHKQAVELLHELQQAKQLDWYQSARLLACAAVNGLREGEEALAAFNRLTPDQPPGLAAWTVDVVLAIATQHTLTADVAHALRNWAERVLPNHRDYVGVWFYRVLLLETEQHNQRALQELEQLLKRYPRYASGLYRMGVVRHQQEDFAGAIESFTRALDINPGLPGAMVMLRDIYEQLGDTHNQLVFIERLEKKLPYDFNQLSEHLSIALSIASERELRAWIDGLGPRLARHDSALLHARLDIWQDNFADAQQRLVGIQADELSDARFGAWLGRRVDCADAAQRADEIIAICREGLQRWPNSLDLMNRLTGALIEVDQAEAKRLLQDYLASDNYDQRIIYKYLWLHRDTATQAAIEVVTAANGQGQQLAEELAPVLRDEELVGHYQAFLEWAYARYSYSQPLGSALAHWYDINRNANKAIEVARQLHASAPDDVNCLHLLGRCLQDKNARESLKYLLKASERIRSADVLTDLGRTYIFLGERQKAIEKYREVLSINPLAIDAWTNLALQDWNPAELANTMNKFLARGLGCSAEYSLVAMVEIAIDQDRQVHPNWIQCALTRLRELEYQQGFKSERKKLTKAIHVWSIVHPEDVQGIELPSQKSVFTALKLAFWPGKDWVPKHKH